MKVFIRIDASVEIGSGHLMRCLTLAGILQERGDSVTFILKEFPVNLSSIPLKKGYTVHLIPSSTDGVSQLQDNRSRADSLEVDWSRDAEETKAILSRENGHPAWLIVDHYGLDNRWETQMRPFVNRIMVIDDLADRQHDCDLLLDQNLYQNMETRYEGLVHNDNCTRLLGPHYALLRPEFQKARRNLRKRGGNVRRILIFFAGGDPTNETTKALEAVMLLNCLAMEIDVIVGSMNPYREQIKQVCASLPNTNYYQQVEYMADLMARADLAIGAGGSTTWERCCLGLPSIVCTLAENQVALTMQAAQNGIVVYLGKASEVSANKLAWEIQHLINNKERYLSLSYNGMQLVDGAGAGRVAKRIREGK